MKRIYRILGTALLLMFIASTAIAAGTVTQTLTRVNDGTVKVLTFSWTGDSGDGTVPSTATSADIATAINGMCIYQVVTNPGSTAPTDDYDIVLNDADGVDMMGGSLANRDTANSEMAVPIMEATSGTPGCRIVNGTITLVISAQNVHSATGTVKVFLRRL